MNINWVKLPIAILSFALVRTTAFALDNTIVDDYWNTTGYVNQTVQEVASPALDATFGTPSAAADSAGTAQQSAFISWFFSLYMSSALPGFNALGPGFLLMLR